MINKCPLTGKPCSKPRVYHVTETGESKATFKNLDLCPDCFQSYIKNKPIENQEPQMPALPNLSQLTPQVADEFVQNMIKFVEDVVQKNQKPMPLPYKVKTCSNCGSTTIDIAKTGKMGCPKCYEAFAEEMEPVIYNAHYSPGSPEKIEHKGKVPKNWKPSSPPPETDKMKLVKLKYKMNLAVQEENYELAAKFRDEMKKIEES